MTVIRTIVTTRSELSKAENVVIVQLDPVVQEVWDTARRISCSWEDSYQKSIRLCHDVASCHVMSRLLVAVSSRSPWTA